MVESLSNRLSAVTVLTQVVRKQLYKEKTAWDKTRNMKMNAVMSLIIVNSYVTTNLCAWLCILVCGHAHTIVRMWMYMCVDTCECLGNIRRLFQPRFLRIFHKHGVYVIFTRMKAPVYLILEAFVASLQDIQALRRVVCIRTLFTGIKLHNLFVSWQRVFIYNLNNYLKIIKMFIVYTSDNIITSFIHTITNVNLLWTFLVQ